MGAIKSIYKFDKLQHIKSNQWLWFVTIWDTVGDIKKFPPTNIYFSLRKESQIISKLPNFDSFHAVWNIRQYRLSHWKGLS